MHKHYVKTGDSKKPISVDSNDNPQPDGHEEDFGLRRSTADEALDFYRQSIDQDACQDDDMTEFLNDE